MLKGRLATMSVVELLRWISRSRSTGTLSVGARGRELDLYFDEGTLVACRSETPATLIGQFLIFSGVIDEQQLQTALQRQEVDGRSLPEILIDDGVVTRDEMEALVRLKAEETLLHLFDIDNDAGFRFLTDGERRQNAIAIRETSEELLAKGRQRVEESRRMRETFAEIDVPSRTDAPVPPEFREDPGMRQVLGALGGQRSVREVKLAAHGTDHAVGSRLLRLLDAGLIVIERPQAFVEVMQDLQALAENGPPATIERARDLLARSEYDACLECLGQLVHEDPTDNEARRMLDDVEALYVAQIRSNGLTPDTIPIPTKPSAAGEQLGPAEMHLFDLCDGSWDTQSLLWIVPLGTVEGIRTLASLERRGLIRFEKPSG